MNGTVQNQPVKNTNQNLKRRKETNSNRSTTTKIRLKDQPHVPNIPDHLLPKNDPIKGVPSAVEKELQSLLDRARVHGMEQIDGFVYYDRNSEDADDDEDDDSTFKDTFQVEMLITISLYQ